MNYRNPRLRRMLAAEYVLGTLRGPARRRFETLARADAALRAEQHWWESQLGRLALRLPPVQPRETVWIGLQRRIGQGNTVPLRPAAPAPAPARSPLWRVAAGMAAMIVMAAIMIVAQRQNTPPAPAPLTQAGPAYVAQLKVPDSTMQWTVRVMPNSGQMTVLAAGDYPQLGAHSMELWWISPQGPVALGLLPTQGSGSMPLPKELTAAGGITLAVSLEPQGGSPTGKPTGPVLTSGAASLAA